MDIASEGASRKPPRLVLDRVIRCQDQDGEGPGVKRPEPAENHDPERHLPTAEAHVSEQRQA